MGTYYSRMFFHIYRVLEISLLFPYPILKGTEHGGNVMLFTLAIVSFSVLAWEGLPSHKSTFPLL